MTLSVSVQFVSSAKHLPNRAQVRRWALAAHGTAADGVVTIRYVDEKEGRTLNREFRGKDYATNVLTFVHDQTPSPLAGEGWGGVRSSSGNAFTPSQPPPARGGGASGNAATNYAADIVICAPVIAREAREQKKPVADHHGHMVVHGMLHAQGFDHENDADAAAMEAIEIVVLRRFRIKNPYEIE